eukprot:PhF_6_TR2217/c0_g1_i2/m.3698
MNPAAKFIHSDDEDSCRSEPSDSGIKPYTDGKSFGIQRPTLKATSMASSAVCISSPTKIQQRNSTQPSSPSVVANASDVSHTVVNLLRDLTQFVTAKQMEEHSMRKHIAELENSGSVVGRGGGMSMSQMLALPGDDLSTLHQDMRDLRTRSETQSKIWAQKECEMRTALHDAQVEITVLSSKLADAENHYREQREKTEELTLMYKGKLREEDRLKEETQKTQDICASKERRAISDLKDAEVKIAALSIELDHERTRNAKLRMDICASNEEALRAKDEAARVRADSTKEIQTITLQLEFLQQKLDGDKKMYEKEIAALKDREMSLQHSCSTTEKQRVESEAELHFTIMKLRREVVTYKDELELLRRDKSKALEFEISERDKTIGRLERARDELAAECAQLNLLVTELKTQKGVYGATGYPEFPPSSSMVRPSVPHPPFEDELGSNYIASRSPSPGRGQQGPRLRQLIELNNELRQNVQTLTEENLKLKELLEQRSEQLIMKERQVMLWRSKCQGQPQLDPKEIADLKLKIAGLETTEASLRAQLKEMQVLYNCKR